MGNSSCEAVRAFWQITLKRVGKLKKGILSIFSLLFEVREQSTVRACFVERYRVGNG